MIGARSDPNDPPLRLGIDVGGTFVDCAVLAGERLVALGKAPATPDDHASGVLDAIGDAAAGLGLETAELLGRAEAVVHGTTLGLNTLLARTGAAVGLLATRGHEDAVLIGRVHQKVAGLGPDETIRVAHLDKPEPLVPRWRIHGIDERVDANGAELVPLDEAGVERAVEALLADGCASIAIAFLWSFRDPTHERRAAAIAERIRPGLPVSISSEVAPSLGEYERTAATIVNAYVGPAQERYLDRLGAALAAGGFRGGLEVLRSSGGSMAGSAAARRPVETIRSGPVGGVLAAARLGTDLGRPDLVATDLGGTSFDVGLVVDGRPVETDVTVAARLHLAVASIDIESVGAGGGSIAWIDDGGGVHVGPMSAGADPGPACYGRGGQAATVTDADLILGRLDPAAVLGGRIRLDRAAADRAVGELADRLGIGPTEMAAGIVRLADASMADLVRRVTIERGRDPRAALFVAYGGAAALHAGAFAFDAGATEVVVPVGASLFSAQGLALADPGRTYQRFGPLPVPLDPADVSRLFREMAAAARRDLTGRSIEIRREIDFRYRRQTHRLVVPLEDARIDRAALERTVQRFERDYERVYGPGTAYRSAGIEAIAFRVSARVPRHDGSTTDAAPPARLRRRLPRPDGSRRVHLGRWRRTPAYDGSRTRPGDTIEGPAVVDWPTTTLLVHPGQSATFDAFGHAHLTRES